jgi:polysaccharide pyruvyl transferase WcaK-like protein
MIHNLRERLPSADLFCVCYAPRDTTARHGLRAVPISALDSHSTPRGLVRYRRNRLARVLRALFLRAPGELVAWIRAWSLLRGTSMIVMTGTGMLTDYSTSAFGYPYVIFKWAFAARLAGCKVRFVSVGVGPLYGRLSRRFIRFALALADYRSYRDLQSKTRIEQAGFDAHGDHVVPDLAFSLPRACLVPPDVRPGPRRVIGVGIINHVDPHVTGQRIREAMYRSYLERMSAFTAWLIDHGYGVRVLHGDVRHDVSVRRDLKVLMAARGVDYDEAGIEDEDVSSTADLLKHLSHTELIVSPRFHNLVLGVMLGKPVIAISYDPKDDALLEAVGLAGYCQPINDINVDRLIEQFCDLERRSEVLRPLLRQKAEEYRQQLDEQYRLILERL